MKRKITKLEQKLIDKGFRLDRKIYTGLHSEHTLFYVYKGQVCFDDKYNTNVEVEVCLDKSRENVEDYSIHNIFRTQDILVYGDLIALGEIFEKVKSVVMYFYMEMPNESGD